MGTAGRVGYQLGAAGAGRSAPWMRALVSAQVDLLPDGPTAEEREGRRRAAEIEDAWRTA
jgi:hypothetical protein